jgi:TRAP-type C4-dicarboxylate transport system permease small subunit
MIKSFGSFLDNICLKILAVTMCILIVLTVTPIVLRLFSITLAWVDPIVRHLVFFNIFLGSILAAGKYNHITVDVLAKFYEKRIWYKRFLMPTIYLLTSVVVGWLASSAFSFARVETQFSRDIAFGFKSGHVAWTIFVLLIILNLRFIVSAFDLYLESYNSKDTN